MNTDCYGMSPEGRSEFEEWYVGRFADNPDYEYAYDRFRAETWAACAKLNREKLTEEKRLHSCTLQHAETLAARIKDQDKEIQRLRAELQESERQVDSLNHDLQHPRGD